MKTSKKSNHISGLTPKIRGCDPEVQCYVAALKAERLKLLKQIAKLQVENESLKDRIKILKEKGGEIKMVVKRSISEKDQ